MENCYKLKDAIQDLIDEGKVVTDGLVKNYDHKAFKKPLPEYEKGEASNVHKKSNAKINHTYTNTDNIINMFEPIGNICLLGPKFDEGPNYDTNDEKPPLIFKTRKDDRSCSSSYPDDMLNVVTRGKSKLVLKLAQDPKNATSSKSVNQPTISTYDLVS